MAVDRRAAKREHEIAMMVATSDRIKADLKTMDDPKERQRRVKAGMATGFGGLSAGRKLAKLEEKNAARYEELEQVTPRRSCAHHKRS